MAWFQPLVSPEVPGDSVTHKMNSQSVTAMSKDKQRSGPNKLLKLVDDFIITDLNSRNHLCILTKHLLGRGNALRA